MLSWCHIQPRPFPAMAGLVPWGQCRLQWCSAHWGWEGGPPKDPAQRLQRLLCACREPAKASAHPPAPSSLRGAPRAEQGWGRAGCSLAGLEAEAPESPWVLWVFPP